MIIHGKLSSLGDRHVKISVQPIEVESIRISYCVYEVVGYGCRKSRHDGKSEIDVRDVDVLVGDVFILAFCHRIRCTERKLVDIFCINHLMCLKWFESYDHYCVHELNDGWNLIDVFKPIDVAHCSIYDDYTKLITDIGDSL